MLLSAGVPTEGWSAEGESAHRTGPVRSGESPGTRDFSKVLQTIVSASLVGYLRQNYFRCASEPEGASPVNYPQFTGSVVP